MSFINMMASDTWSEADILNRTEAIISSEFSPLAAAVLSRKATGAALGQYTLTPEESRDIARYAELSEYAREQGKLALADMQLLLEVLKVEAAILTRNTQLANTEQLPDAEILAEANSTIASASQEVINLVKQRNLVDSENL